MNEVDLARLDIQRYKEKIAKTPIQDLFREVDLFTITTISQEACAMDIKKLEILTKAIVDYMTTKTPVSPPPPINTAEGDVIEEEV